MKKKAISILLALMLVLSLLPVTALADDTLELTSDNCVQIGQDDNDYPIYLYDGEIPEGAATVVFAAVSDAMGEDGMIFPWPGNDVVYGDSAPLTDFYAFDFDAADEAVGITLLDAYADYDFSNCYAYWLMDEDYESYYYIVKMPEPDALPFTVSVGEFVNIVEGGYSYQDDWEDVTADLYVFEVPFGTEDVTIDFGDDYRLLYNYDPSYVDGAYDDYMTGAKETTVSVDRNGNGVSDFIRVQKPYNDGGDLLYAIVFKYPFTLSVSGTALTEYTVTANGYQYTDYLGAVTLCDLYTFTIPAGTESVTVDFARNSLCYNYAATGSDPAAANNDGYLTGAVDDYSVGVSSAECMVDYDGENGFDYLQIQTPYDAMWNTTVLYAITFEEPADDAAPFTAFAGETELTEIVKTAGGYTPYDYDPETWAPVPAAPVPLYTVTVPAGTESVELRFPENVLAYNYSADGTTFIAGAYDDAQAGDAVALVAIDADNDGAIDCIQVQTPYDADWNTTVLYAITFDGAGSSVVPVTVTEDELRNAIAAAYAENGPGNDGNAAWVTADMMTYAGLPDAQAELTEAQKETVKNDAVYTLSSSPSAADAAKNIIALVAMGYDPTQLTAIDGTVFSAKDVLDALAFTESGEAYNEAFYEYTLPYVIMAYRLLDDAEGLQKLIDLALEIKDAWMDTTWGVDGMTPFMVALAPEYGTDSDVKAALDAAAEAVHGAQLPDGCIGNFGASNAASTGLAIAGFTAIGLDPHEIKNGENSLIDGLLTLAANYGGNSLGTALDTEQGFRGLVAAAKGAGFITYSFDTSDLKPAADLSVPSLSFNIQPDSAEAELVLTDAEGAEVAPFSAGVFSRLDVGTYSYTVTAEGYETASGTLNVSADTRKTVYVSLVRSDPDDDLPESSTAVVTVRVLSHDSTVCGGRYTYKYNASAYYSILGDDESYTVTVEKGKSTARDALVATLTHYDIPFTEESNGYFSMINNETEMSHGSSNSGWLHLINGAPATAAATQYVFSGDASMVWFFTDDYTNDYGSEAWTTDPEPSGPSADPSEVILRAGEVKAAADAGQGLTAETGNGTVRFDSETVGKLAETGKDVTVSVKENPDGTTTVDVTVDGKTVDADVKIELPAAGGDGKVLVVINADGTETVVKKSFRDGKKMYAIVPAGAAVRIVDAEGKAFVDVKDGDWFAPSVAFVTCRELFLGTGADRFAPDLPMSRAMLVTVLYRLEDAKSEGGSSFEDVDPAAWYAEAVAWAAKSGIVVGTGTGFKPNAPATREQIATILYRYANLIGLDTSAKGELSSFADGGDTSDWAEDAMAWAVGAGLFRGDETGALDPGGAATRAQVAALFERLVELIVK